MDSNLYMRATPGVMHQRIVLEAAFRIRDYSRKKERGLRSFSISVCSVLNAGNDILEIDSYEISVE